MNSPVVNDGPSVLHIAYLVCIVVFLCAIGYHHFQLVTYPLPLSYNEASLVSVTQYLVQGNNPYATEAQPANTSVYPILYNLIAAALATWFDNTLVLHRVVTAAALVGCAILFFRVTAAACHSRLDALATTALLYCGLMVFSTPLASPNGVGLVIFLGALYLPLLDGFSRRSLLIALLLGIMAFHAKQYFVAALSFVALLLFLKQSKTLGVGFGLAGLIGSLVLLAVILPGSPYYLDALVFAVSGASELASSNTHMWQQWFEYLKVLGPIILALVAGLAARRFLPDTIEQTSGERTLLSVSSPHTPLFTRGVNAHVVFLVCSALIFTVSLGRNPGNELTYLFQLVSPFLLTLAAVAITRSRWQWPLRLLVLIAFYTHYQALSHDFGVRNLDQWQKLEQAVSEAETIYSTPVALELIANKNGEVFNNGHTLYFKLAGRKPALLVRDDPTQRADHLWRQWVSGIHDKVRTRAFDAIIIDAWTPLPDLDLGTDRAVKGSSLLRKYYRPRETLDISLANRPGGGNYKVQIWEPRLNHRD